MMKKFSWMAGALFLALLVPVWSQETEKSLPEIPKPNLPTTEHAIVLDEDDPILEGYGPYETIDYTVQHEGMLFLYALSEETDLYLRVLVAGKVETLLAEDDDNGGGTTPFAQLEVKKGDTLKVIVASKTTEVKGDTTLRIIEAPETNETQTTAEMLDVVINEGYELIKKGDVTNGRTRMVGAVKEALMVNGATESYNIQDRLETLGLELLKLGDLNTSCTALSTVYAFRTKALPENHWNMQAAQGNLALAFRALGDLHTTRYLLEKMLDILSRTLPENHPDLQGARLNLALTIRELGDPHASRALYEKVLKVYSETLPDDNLKLQSVREGIALTLIDLRDFEAAQILQQKVLDVYSNTLSDDHLDLQRARMNMAIIYSNLGDYRSARMMYEKSLQVLSRKLPDDHPQLQSTRLNLAVALQKLGDLQAARKLQEKVLEVQSRTLSETHPKLQQTRISLAWTLKTLGDFHGARKLLEKVFKIYSGSLPDDHPKLQSARLNLASTLKALGDLLTARMLEEKVLEVRMRTLPDDHFNLQTVRLNLARTTKLLGDLQAAKVLEEKVLEIYSRTLPENHPNQQLVRLNLGITLARLGNLTAARKLQEKVLEVYSSTLPDDHPHLQAARLNLSSTLASLKDFSASRELIEKALEVCSQTLPVDHPDLQKVRGSLASIIKSLGDINTAYEIEKKVLKVYEQTIPNDHPDLQRARLSYASTCLQLDNLDRCLEISRDLSRGIRERFIKFESILAPRELEAMAIKAECGTSSVLSWIPLADLKTDLFETFALTEALRASGTTAIRMRHLIDNIEENSKISELHEDIQRASIDEVRFSKDRTETQKYFKAVRRKEAAERKLRLHIDPLLERLGAIPKADAKAIMETLTPGEAAVGYWRYRRYEYNHETKEIGQGIPCYLAFVLKPSKAPLRIELGEAQHIEEAVKTWRRAVLTPLERGLSRKNNSYIEKTITVHGKNLRRLIFDPLVPSIGDAKRIIMALDDILHLVPLDALPDDIESNSALLGDHLEIHTHATLKELTLRKHEINKIPSLLTFGGIDYDNTPQSFTNKQADTDMNMEKVQGNKILANTFRGAVKCLVRGEDWECVFNPLPSSGPEVDSISEIFLKAFPRASKPLCFKGRGASREAFEILSPKVRYLHVATHGYFAPEAVPSLRDELAENKSQELGIFSDLREQVIGFTPMVLCGLAFAGANIESNNYGYIPGLMTAEEIAGLDLSKCELAVLSACDTNVGERRAGQGIASMQQALWAAGVRSAITSLWKVPDEATRVLMTDFYRRLWIEKKPKAQALWEAKCKLRRIKDAFGEPKYTLRDWAGWMLTGDPE